MCIIYLLFFFPPTDFFDDEIYFFLYVLLSLFSSVPLWNTNVKHTHIAAAKDILTSINHATPSSFLCFN